MKDELGMEMYPININLPNGAELDSGIGLVTVTDLGPGMTDDEIAAFLIEERENQDYSTLAGIMIGVGFLLILISFGARRKKKGGAKRTEKKPAN